MKKLVVFAICSMLTLRCYCWGFYGHQKINYYAVFLLPPEMLVFYKPNIAFITEHAVDPDKRRYIVPEEGPRHYIDIDRYGKHPFPTLPRKWEEAVKTFGEDSLRANGIVPWWIQVMLQRLTHAFKQGNASAILKLSAELGHYIADAHVPLHASHNHNGQYTNQSGIHGLWESRIPELLEKHWDFFIGPAAYISDPLRFTWARVLESAAAADTVLLFEKELTAHFPAAEKYAYEQRNNIVIKQYSSAFTIAYDKKMKGMAERRMRQSVFAVASFWYTAWVNAGQPSLGKLSAKEFSLEETKDLDTLNTAWKTGATLMRACD
jgi:hypothetical protein